MALAPQNEGGQFNKFLITNSRNDTTWEKAYPLSFSAKDLKYRLEMLTGIESSGMIIEYYVDKRKVTTIGDDVANLESVVESEGNQHRLHVLDLKGGGNDEFNKVDSVPKFELSDEDYARRTESLRQFKMAHKLGRFSGGSGDSVYNDAQLWAIMDSINIGDKVEVLVKGKPNRKGRITFKGTIHVKPGPWVGIRYDEAVGKHDGLIEGVRYFECEEKHGAFVRPNDVYINDT